jgi:hypothetical protein
MAFSFIRQLSESRMFPSIKSLVDLGTQEIAERLYLHLLGLRILLCCEETREWAQISVRQTIQTNSFARWRTDATDLYVLLHGLEVREAAEDQAYGSYRLNPVLLQQWLRDAAHGRTDETRTRRLFVRLDHDLKITHEPERSLRRQVVEWRNLDHERQHQTVTKLVQTLLHRAPRAEILSHLKTLLQSRALQENASAGATSAASVATSVGGLGGGFDPNGHARSIYPDPKGKPKKPMLLKR